MAVLEGVFAALLVAGAVMSALTASVAWYVVLGAFSPVVIALPIVEFVRANARRQRATAAAVAEGRVGVARIDSIRRTGLVVNDDPQVRFELTVSMTPGVHYRTRMKQLVDLVNLADFARGSFHPAVQLHPNDPKVAIVDGIAVPDFEARVSRFPEAHAVPEWTAENGNPHAVVSTLAYPGGNHHGAVSTHAHPGRTRPRRRGGVLARIGGFALALAAVLLPNLSLVEPATAAVVGAVTGAPDRELLDDAAHLTRALDEVRAAAGSDLAETVKVWGNRVQVTTAVAGAPQYGTDHVWRLPRFDFERPGLSDALPHAGGVDEANLFSVDDVAWDAIPRLVVDAAARLQASPLPPAIRGELRLEYVSVSSVFSSARQPEIRVYFFGERGSEHALYDARGTFVSATFDGQTGGSPAGGSPDPATTAPAYVPLDVDFVNNAGDLQGALDELRATVGSDEAHRLIVAESRLSAEVATAPGSTSLDSWSWHVPTGPDDAAVQNDGPEGTTEDPMFALSQVDASRLVELFADVRQRAGIADSDAQSESLVIHHVAGRHVIQIHMGDGTANVAMRYTLDGTFIEELAQ